MKSSTIIMYSLAAVLVLSLFVSVNSVAVSSRFRSRQTSNSTNSTDNSNSSGSQSNSTSIYNGSNTGNTRFQLCPVATGDNININAALGNLTAGLPNDITSNQPGFNGDYATGIANSLGAAGTAINNGFSNIGSDINNAATAVYNGAADAVKSVGNGIADAAYSIGNIFSSGSTVTATSNQNNSSNNAVVGNSTIDSLRRNISGYLDQQDSWTQANTNYNDVVVNSRAILYLNQQYLVSNIELDDKDEIGLNNQSSCSFITGGAYPSNSQACTKGYDIIQPYLVNYALAYKNDDVVAALYWVLQILPALPQLSNNCLNTGFSIVERSFDDSNCEDSMLDLAETVSDLATGNYFSATTQKLRNRYILTRYIPRVVGYCIGTTN